jgi:hypothetical protein
MPTTGPCQPGKSPSDTYSEGRRDHPHLCRAHSPSRRDADHGRTAKTTVCGKQCGHHQPVRQGCNGTSRPDPDNILRTLRRPVRDPVPLPGREGAGGRLAAVGDGILRITATTLQQIAWQLDPISAAEDRIVAWIFSWAEHVEWRRIGCRDEGTTLALSSRRLYRRVRRHRPALRRIAHCPGMCPVDSRIALGQGHERGSGRV